MEAESETLSKAYTVEDGLVFYENRWLVPDNTELKLAILRENHDSRIAGHFGMKKTQERMMRNFYWPNMEEFVREYVRSCDICQRDKTARHRRYGLLQPLEVPYRPWTSISMDFIVALPDCDGYTQIWTIVDRFSKMAHFIPLKTGEDNATSVLAKTFLKEIWRLHGLPSDIVSDRDTRFGSKLWEELMSHLNVELHKSTSFHPQTDGQTERVNWIAEEYLRHYCSFQQDDWVELLPLGEYAYNSAIQESAKMSSFCVNYGFESET